MQSEGMLYEKKRRHSIYAYEAMIAVVGLDEFHIPSTTTVGKKGHKYTLCSNSVTCIAIMFFHSISPNDTKFI